MAGVSRVALAALFGAVVIFAGIGWLAFRALEPTTVGTAGTGGPARCGPGPCINAGAFEIDITGIDIVRLSRGSLPSPNGQAVKIDVHFRNHSNDSLTANGNHERADLIDFSLLDAGRLEHHPDYSFTGCAHWDSYEIPQFESYGPKPVCFVVPSASGPFKLRWDPDLGLFSHPYDLRLPDPARG